ncbi:MAG: methyl-accepting chemotaxis protein [Bacillota bacterium]|nr:methyl-accepting chemotaxis protein [Bacillota bacterium]
MTKKIRVNMQIKNLLLLILVFIPFLVTMVSSFVVFDSLSDDGVAINLSGSQRMRTMLIANYAQQFYYADDNSEKASDAEEMLINEIAKYNKIMNALVKGDSSLKIAANDNQVIVDMINDITPAIDKYVSATNDLISGKDIEKNQTFIIANALPIKNSIHKVVLEYQKYYDKKIDGLKSTFFTFLGFGVFVLIGSSIISRKSIIMPIQKMTKIMQEIATGNGDLTKRVNIKSNDEIGLLADYFNQFAETIQNIIVSVKSLSTDTQNATNDILNVVTNLNESIKEVSLASDDVAEGATEQISFASDISESIEENNNQIQNGLEKISETEKISDEAVKSAKVGIDAIGVAVSQFKEVTRTINFATDSIEKLNLRMDEIGNIVEIISGISNQTNLLALNASIEAARAGEHGRGFSVVADEVRKLAEESEDATAKITALITDIQTETKVNVNTMKSNVVNVGKQTEMINKGSEALTEISNQVDDSSTKIAEVSITIKNIANKMDSISNAYGNMLEVISTTSAATEEVSASVNTQLGDIESAREFMEELKTLSEELQGEIDRFIV